MSVKNRCRAKQYDFFDDIDINALKRFYHVGYVPQKSEITYEFPITVNEFLSYAYLKRKDAYFTSVINALDLNPIYNENINNLSGGAAPKGVNRPGVIKQAEIIDFGRADRLYR